jgi:hypothetical protein
MGDIFGMEKELYLREYQGFHSGHFIEQSLTQTEENISARSFIVTYLVLPKLEPTTYT